MEPCWGYDAPADVQRRACVAELTCLGASHKSRAKGPAAAPRHPDSPPRGAARPPLPWTDVASGIINRQMRHQQSESVPDTPSPRSRVEPRRPRGARALRVARASLGSRPCHRHLRTAHLSPAERPPLRIRPPTTEGGRAELRRGVTRRRPRHSCPALARANEYTRRVQGGGYRLTRASPPWNWHEAAPVGQPSPDSAPAEAQSLPVPVYSRADRQRAHGRPRFREKDPAAQHSSSIDSPEAQTRRR